MTELFNVINRQTKHIAKVYGIEDDSNGYPKFLIREREQWIWKSAKYFIPIEAEEQWKSIFNGDNLK